MLEFSDLWWSECTSMGHPNIQNMKQPHSRSGYVATLVNNLQSKISSNSLIHHQARWNRLTFLGLYYLSEGIRGKDTLLISFFIV